MVKNASLSPVKTRKIESSTKTENRKNISKQHLEKTVVFNFRVSAEFKKDFKISSAINGITQSELLKQIFEEWKKRHG